MGESSSGATPTNHLYHNNRDGTFTDVSEKAEVARSGWGRGGCVGDYDNDGYRETALLQRCQVQAAQCD